MSWVELEREVLLVLMVVVMWMQMRMEELEEPQQEHGRRYVRILRLVWQRMLQSLELRLRWKTKCYE